ncbi:hypothetical protein [Ensifer sp.]|uniref:hypothetical protein n=1 Tax=Ensifer sp. TaxID=1872086 RepID=UPI00289E75AB|nr:hypothetical protein [Ensifer sp.]
MADVTPPKRPQNYPDRQLDCEEAMEAAFQAVVERAAAAGWSSQETALGLIGLVQAHIHSMRENEKTELAIARARGPRVLH